VKVTALELANAVLEGEDPKDIFRRASAFQQEDFQKFMDAYYEAMLWSTSLSPYGTCPDCGAENQVLDRWNEQSVPVCRNCSEREPHHEPPGDKNYTSADLSEGLKASSTTDCRAFFRENLTDLKSVKSIQGYPAMEMAGHDFWLTRNGHGVGFSDRDEWGDEAMERLDASARNFGEIYIYVGDDGKIYA
jgi:hypothetical protein